MDFSVSGRAGCVDVGDIEQARISSTGKPRRECFADSRMSTVAAGKMSRFANFFRTVRQSERSDYAFGTSIAADQLRPALDFDAQGTQPFDQQTLVGVLWIHQHIW